MFQLAKYSLRSTVFLYMHNAPKKSHLGFLTSAKILAFNLIQHYQGRCQLSMLVPPPCWPQRITTPPFHLPTSLSPLTATSCAFNTSLAPGKSCPSGQLHLQKQIQLRKRSPIQKLTPLHIWTLLNAAVPQQRDTSKGQLTQVKIKVSFCIRKARKRMHYQQGTGVALHNLLLFLPAFSYWTPTYRLMLEQLDCHRKMINDYGRVGNAIRLQLLALIFGAYQQHCQF